MAVASPSSSLLPSAHLQDFPYPPPPRCRRVIAFGSPSVLLRRSSPAAVPLRKKPPRRSWCCGAASSGPPSRGPDPPPLGDDPDPVAGLQVTLSRIQDKVRIFFAVLFWMSLFFWGSAWDGRENSRKNKGPPFRK